MPTISPSLSNMGKLRLGTKSDIVSCLEGLVPTSKDDAIAVFHPSPSLGVPTVDAVILNGAVIDYASYIFLPYTTRQLEHVHGVDVVWDEYVHGSLKTFTRSVTGKGIHRHIESSNALLAGISEDRQKQVRVFLFLVSANRKT